MNIIDSSEYQSTHRAHLHTLAALGASGFCKGSISERRNDTFESPSDQTDGSDAEFFPADPDAFATKDTLVGIVGEEGTALIYGEISFEFFESFRLEFDTKMFSDFLEFTRTVL